MPLPNHFALLCGRRSDGAAMIRAATLSVSFQLSNTLIIEHDGDPNGCADQKGIVRFRADDGRGEKASGI